MDTLTAEESEVALLALPSGDRYELVLEVATPLFSELRAARMATHLLRLVVAVLRHPGLKVAMLAQHVVDGAEVHLQRVEWNAVAADAPGDAHASALMANTDVDLVGLVARHVATCPDAIALAGGSWG